MAGTDDCDVCGRPAHNLYHNEVLGLALCATCDNAVERVGNACYNAGAADARAAVGDNLRRTIQKVADDIGILL